MIATQALSYMGACAQPMKRPQGPLSVFSVMEGVGLAP